MSDMDGSKILEKMQGTQHNAVYLVSGESALQPVSGEAKLYYEWVDEMNKKARDTQFAGFASRLMQDLRRYENPELIIARRAYDLVKHLLQNAEPIDLDTSGNYTSISDEEAAQRIANLPDMTTWPEEEQEPEWDREEIRKALKEHLFPEEEG